MHAHTAAVPSFVALPSTPALSRTARATEIVASSSDDGLSDELSDELLEHVVGGLVRPWPRDLPLHLPQL